MDVVVGDYFGVVGDGVGDDEVVIVCVDLLVGVYCVIVVLCIECGVGWC